MMSTMTAHIFLTYVDCNQMQYMQGYFQKLPEMKVLTFTIRFLQLNIYLAYFPPNHSGQPEASLSKDKVKEIIYHTMPNLWKN